jgi:hypothetical protein
VADPRRVVEQVARCRTVDIDQDGARCTLLGVELPPGDLRVDRAEYEVRSGG